MDGMTNPQPIPEGQAPLERIPGNPVPTTCPKCGGKAIRETFYDPAACRGIGGYVEPITCLSECAATIGEPREVKPS